ncbi:hypothetical protein Q1695_004593 [Nippostrongylus brasiliensis]|nr:hypothetical protein Q1695_004593 [Nippostrongylus brasiliensis]
METNEEMEVNEHDFAASSPEHSDDGELTISTQEMEQADSLYDVPSTSYSTSSSVGCSSSAKRIADGSVHRGQCNESFSGDAQQETELSALPSVALNGEGNLCKPLTILWKRLRRLGCIIDAAQTRSTRRKLKCAVDRCVYRGGPFESVQLRCTVPANIERAIQWICICVLDPVRQNAHILKFLDVLKTYKHRNTGGSEQVASPKVLIAFPFRICSRHFPLDDSDVPIAPMFYLPKKIPIRLDDLLSKLRRRSVILSEYGYEDIEVDKLEPNGVLITNGSPPISCDVPGCRYKSSDVSVFSGRFIKMFSVPENSLDHSKWRTAVHNGIGLPSTFEYNLPDGARICEMHFVGGKRYSRGVMKDPTVFHRLVVDGINPSLSRLGPIRTTYCAARGCCYSDFKTACVPFPSINDPLYSRWFVALLKADESFKVDKDTAVCLRHFSNSEFEGTAPVLHLTSDDTRKELSGNQPLPKRTQTVSSVVQPKRIRLTQSGDSFRTSLSAIASERVREQNCCSEIKNVAEIVQRVEVQSRAVERLVMQLNHVCRSGLVPIDGTLERKVKFQLFDILSELRSQKGIVHTLRHRLNEAIRIEEVRNPAVLTPVPLLQPEITQPLGHSLEFDHSGQPEDP